MIKDCKRTANRSAGPASQGRRTKGTSSKGQHQRLAGSRAQPPPAEPPRERGLAALVRAPDPAQAIGTGGKGAEAGRAARLPAGALRHRLLPSSHDGLPRPPTGNRAEARKQPLMVSASCSQALASAGSAGSSADEGKEVPLDCGQLPIALSKLPWRTASGQSCRDAAASPAPR
eukprot:CAMPEP_0175768184 /NCGR_PEP_ID=MMETSP0097-20121207/70299_1 /TAXON_ID=311494 /ORGANISM="Alexandrium monilatum, Strain CCMP3105" /LENGTH=173 /DNA_ID=CAMNT_0017078291 /DNA_START=60 /DNA_END=579 /DNA_ORIENTATION=+